MYFLNIHETLDLIISMKEDGKVEELKIITEQDNICMQVAYIVPFKSSLNYLEYWRQCQGWRSVYSVAIREHSKEESVGDKAFCFQTLSSAVA